MCYSADMQDSPSDEQVRAVMRALSHRRKRETRPCATCGSLMENVLPHKRYCSNRCTVKAWRQRQQTARNSQP